MIKKTKMIMEQDCLLI